MMYLHSGTHRFYWLFPFNENTEMTSVWFSSFNATVEYYSRISNIDIKHLKRMKQP